MLNITNHWEMPIKTTTYPLGGQLFIAHVHEHTHTHTHTGKWQVLDRMWKNGNSCTRLVGI